MTIIYSLNSLVMVHKIICVKWNINFMFIKLKFYLYQKNSITSLSKIVTTYKNCHIWIEMIEVKWALDYYIIKLKTRIYRKGK